MIRRLEALRYRSLLHVERELSGLQVLFGPNGSGKSTFLDILDFLGDVIREGVDEAALERSPDWRDLLWKSRGASFELAVEAEIPDRLRRELSDSQYRRCRYQMSLGELPAAGVPEAFGIREETLGLRQGREEAAHQPGLFPDAIDPPETILDSFKTRDTKTVVHKIPDGHDHFYDETGAGWSPTFKLGPKRCALANLPDDPSKFPVATWFKRLLVEETSRVVLDPESLRRPAPPGQGRSLAADGSNVAWLVRSLADEHPDAYEAWLDRLRGDFTGIGDVETTVRDEDRHCFLTVEHPSGHRVDSWGISGGTLRSMVFALVPHTDGLPETLLVEEPENGIHPDGVRGVYSALLDADDVQILATSHSPVLVDACAPGERLDFETDAEGATRIEAPDS